MVHISRGAKPRPALRIAAMPKACTATTTALWPFRELLTIFSDFPTHQTLVR